MKQRNKYLRTNQLYNRRPAPAGKDFMCLAQAYVLDTGAV